MGVICHWCRQRIGKQVSLVNQDVVPSENPFEGKSTDVPITTVSREIEIDLREMLSEPPASIPAPIEPQYDTQT
jgi:predicted membrane chloride channel (bestrophin family)